uniref:Uncharacterized protein n=1 Tax=Solanum tuberosum TaxID=4113 RepID=M1DPR9_SOLTU
MNGNYGYQRNQVLSSLYPEPQEARPHENETNLTNGTRIEVWKVSDKCKLVSQRSSLRIADEAGDPDLDRSWTKDSFKVEFVKLGVPRKLLANHRPGRILRSILVLELNEIVAATTTSPLCFWFARGRGRKTKTTKLMVGVEVWKVSDKCKLASQRSNLRIADEAGDTDLDRSWTKDSFKVEFVKLGVPRKLLANHRPGRLLRSSSLFGPPI